MKKRRLKACYFLKDSVKIPKGWSTRFTSDPSKLRAIGMYLLLKRVTSSSVIKNFSSQSKTHLAHRFGVSHRTMMRRIKDIEQMGLCFMAPNGTLRLLSLEKARKMFGGSMKSVWLNLGDYKERDFILWIKSIAIYEKQNLMRKAELRSITQEHRREYKKTKVNSEQLAEADPHERLGTRGVANLVGRRHYSTGVRLQKKLELMGLLLVTRFKPAFVCDTKGMGYDVPRPYFFWGGQLFYPRVNRLEVIPFKVNIT